jgi:hypothetical protein
VISVFAVAVLAAACRQDMHDQPKYKPQARSEFFDDQRAARPLVAGTVARGQLRDDARFFTGKVAGSYVDSVPFPVTRDVLKRGQQRYQIFCAPCHGQTGRGDGMVVRRGYRKPSPLHQERLRNEPVGYFFDVVTSGFGAMPDYASQIPPEDRWAIVAYVRALQLSQHATLAEVPGGRHPELEKP